jgi:NAD-dependent DNA ligase
MVSSSEDTSNSEFKFDGEVFCFSGFRDGGLERHITDHGGVVCNTGITKKTTILLIAEFSGSKYDKAVSNKIHIENVHQFKLKNNLSNS